MDGAGASDSLPAIAGDRSRKGYAAMGRRAAAVSVEAWGGAAADADLRGSSKYSDSSVLCDSHFTMRLIYFTLKLLDA